MLPTNQYSLLTKLIICLVFFSGNQLMAKPTKQCTAQECRQFDFWIGNWEVKNADGKIVGYNKVYPILDGCALSA